MSSGRRYLAPAFARNSKPSLQGHAAKRTIFAMKPSSTNETKPFSDALSKLVSIPRAEMQKRLDSAPKEAVSRHKRYKYVPAERPSKP